MAVFGQFSLPNKYPYWYVNSIPQSILRNLLCLEVKEIIYYRLFCLELVALSIEECAISSSFGWSCKRINSLPFSCNLILNVNSKILPQMERFIEVTERVRTCMFVSICTDIYDTDKLNYWFLKLLAGRNFPKILFGHVIHT